MTASSPHHEVQGYIVLTQRALERTRIFYQKDHPEIKASHGWEHVKRVYDHTNCALKSLTKPLPPVDAMEVSVAAVLHDVDDKKYFPKTRNGQYPHAAAILESIGLTDNGNDNATIEDDSSPESHSSYRRILKLISWVSCSENGNSVPDGVASTGNYYWLIPRWADRLEAVGSRGVLRCYQYTLEQGSLLFSTESPRPQTEEELWITYADPGRFQAYQERGGSSTDMISHYYDKLLHIAFPPKQIVRNPYLEAMAEESSTELVEVCMRYGRTGVVDEEYILSLMPDAESGIRKQEPAPPVTIGTAQSTKQMVSGGVKS
jgi:uncharacterized protein